MEVGRVVAFFEQKKVVCAVCLEAKTDKCYLLTEENKEVTLGENRLAYISSRLMKVDLHRDLIVQELKDLTQRVREVQNSLCIKELWELVNNEGREFSLRELVELTFNSPQSEAQELALFRALAEDRIYFKQKGDFYEPRVPEQVDQILQQREIEAQKEQEIQEASFWLAKVWKNEQTEPPAHKEEIIKLLKEIAIWGTEANNYEKGKIICQQAQIPFPEGAWEILVRLGEWEEDENLFLYRYQIPQEFPQQVLAETEKIMAEARVENPRPQDRDLTFLHPFTIDSEYTRDIDDALSLKKIGTAYQVGVHITDVATYINGRQEIFQEAMFRATSIYLPDQRISMIPPMVSESACSLIVGEKRRALSFLIKMDEEGRVLDYQIVPSIIQVEQRLSYESADHLLEEEEENLTILQRLAQKLGQKRMEAGAFFIPRPERVIRISREKEIFISKRERESPAQKIVSEFMILANTLAAGFLKEKGIPAIFRGQNEPREKMPVIDKFDPLQAYRLRRLMNRVEISTRPQRHAGLGTEAYLTLTSPIRRFYDLLMEIQILRALRGETVFKEEELQEIIMRVSPVLSRVNLVEELTERYWIYRFLEKKIGATFTAVVLDRLANKYLVHINDFLLEVEMPLVAGREFVPGDEILVQVEKAHARSGLLKISPL